MYPYNTGNKIDNLWSNSTKDKENNTGDNSDDCLLKTDKRLLKIINLAKKETKELQIIYSQLMDSELLLEDRALIQTMYLDEIKHLKELNDIIYNLKNNSCDNNENLDTDNDNDLDLNNETKKLIEKLILLEMDNVNFYKNLAQSIPVTDDDFVQNIINILNSISSTKQTHATGLSYLYSKYF